MNKLPAIWQFVIMVAAVGATAFGVFKWMDAREDAETDITDWMAQQEKVHASDEEFKLRVTDGIDLLVAKTDSALVIGQQNQRAIYANRNTILRQIKNDTSLTSEQVIELMQPFMDGIEDLKKNNGMTSYDIE